MSRLICLLAIIAMVTVVTPSARAGKSNSFVETFYSTGAGDLAQSTAFWDTLSGLLRLPGLVELGDRPTFRNTMHVTVSGQYAYASVDQHGMLVFDISDLSNPTLADSIHTDEQIREIEIVGDYAYLANVFLGLSVMDISDPTDVKFVATFTTVGQTPGIDIDGDYAYLADGAVGLSILNISDPTHPSLVGVYNTLGYAQKVRVSGGYAFLADWTEGLKVIDISDRSNPWLAGSYNTAGLARAIALQGNLVYVMDSAAGMLIFDCSDPTQPLLLATLDTHSLARGISVDGHFAYVADHAAGLNVVDVSDPTQPFVLATVPSVSYSHGFYANGTYGVAADGYGGVKTHRIARHRAALEFKGSYSMPARADRGAVMAGRIVVLGNGSSGIEMVNISVPNAPVLAGRIDAGIDVADVATDGRILYVVGSAGTGLRIYDISNPSSPDTLGQLALGVSNTEVAVDGNLVFVVSDDTTIVVVDATDSANPFTATSWSLSSPIADILPDGDRIFVAHSDSRSMSVVNVTDTSSLSVIGTYAGGGTSSNRVVVEGDVAWLASKVDGVVDIIDISDITQPALVTSLPLPGASAVEVRGDVLLVTGSTGLTVYDNSNPKAPVFVHSYASTLPMDMYGVSMFGDYAIVDGEGVEIVRVLERAIENDLNVAVSRKINEGTDNVIRARIAASAGATQWSVSADGGSLWQSVPADNLWQPLGAPGDDLRWRAELAPYDLELGSAVPTVSQVNLEWLLDYPCIELITDIPDDQGDQLGLAWQRSGHDFVDDSTSVVAYTVWGRFGSSSQWDSLATVPATNEEYYGAVVAASKTTVTHYRITANLAGGGTYWSPPDSADSVDDIAPNPPTNVRIAYNASRTFIGWDAPGDPDVVRYNIYRSPNPVFNPVPVWLLASTSDLSFSDPYGGPAYYYKVTALDSEPNESVAASGTPVTSAAEPALPSTFALHPNYPNPFNPVTTLTYDVPAPGAVVSIAIYDVGGRLISKLVDGPVAAGRRSVTWNGHDHSGNRVGSGVYFCRMTAPGAVYTRKLTLIQ